MSEHPTSAGGVLVPGWPWAIEDGRVCHRGQPVRRADLVSFQPLGKFWARDAARVYCAGVEVRDADAATFRVLNDVYAKDARHAYTVLKGPIAGADPDSFEACGPTGHAFNTANGHAKDARSVYHTTFGGKASVLKGADPGTFAACGRGYGADRAAVYFERKRLPGADPAEWRHLRGPHSRSGRHAYFLNERVAGADGGTLDPLPILELGSYWCRDAAGYYLNTGPGDSSAYLAAFRECFVFLGRVSGIELTWGRSNRLPPTEDASWAVAEHAWIDVLCEEWLQRPAGYAGAAPETGKPFRFGEALHLHLLNPPRWAEERRVWIFRPVPDHLRAERTPSLWAVPLWWEYGSPGHEDAIRALITQASDG